jgi:hypothetical protein
MKVRIELLQPTPEPEEKLRADGWEIQSEETNVFVARHPEIGDEETAREHLDQLGLLTMPTVRIEFLPADGGSPPGGGLPT